MINHRNQHNDDRTKTEASREGRATLWDVDPVTQARVRTYLYWERLAVQESSEERSDIEFAALSGPNVGPVARGYESSRHRSPPQ